MRDFQDLQDNVVDVGTEAFGANSIHDPKERLLRFAEEAIELLQAGGLTLSDVIRMAQHVYSRPAGEFHQELGGAGVTLMAVAAAHGHHLLVETTREIERVHKNIPAIRAKAAKKPSEIFAVRPLQ